MHSFSLAFQSSREGSALLVDAIINQSVVSLADNLAHLDLVHSRIVQSCEDQFQTSFASIFILSGLPPITGRAIWWAVDFHTSNWLNVLPLVHHHFDLSVQQFCDALFAHCP